MSNSNKIDHNRFKRFAHATLSELNVSEEVSGAVIDALTQASLFGIDSHGVNLFCHYVDCVRKGRVNPNGELCFKTNANAISCDARRNFSHYAARITLQKLDEITQSSGIAIGNIINSDHIGAVGIHAYNACIHNKLILGFTNADPLAVTPDRKSVVFGTNPISCVYRSTDMLLYIDLATTNFSMNKVKNYRRENLQLPENVATDSHLIGTTDPNNAEFLTPIGEHKGFALAFMVDLLCGGLTGKSPSHLIEPMYKDEPSSFRDLTHTFIVINPIFVNPDGEDAKHSLIRFISSIRDQFSDAHKNESPGLKERICEARRVADGIPVPDSIINEWVKYKHWND